MKKTLIVALMMASSVVYAVTIQEASKMWELGGKVRYANTPADYGYPWMHGKPFSKDQKSLLDETCPKILEADPKYILEACQRWAYDKVVDKR